MSPSENQLRAALRDGEGGSPDPDQIIQAAVTLRRERRQLQRRVAGAVAGIVIVGGVGIGLATTRADDKASSSSERAADGNFNGLSAPLHSAAGDATGPQAAGGAAVPTQAPQAGGATYGSATSSHSGCPAKSVEYQLPGGGGSGQFDETAPLFATPVQTVVLCSYSPETGAFVSEITLTGDSAKQFVDSLTTSSNQTASLDCLSPIKMEILATDSGGAALTPLSVVGTCRQVAVTNGTALRYAQITDLTAVGVPATVVPSPTGIESGSPPR